MTHFQHLSKLRLKRSSCLGHRFSFGRSTFPHGHTSNTWLFQGQLRSQSVSGHRRRRRTTQTSRSVLDTDSTTSSTGVLTTQEIGGSTDLSGGVVCQVQRRLEVWQHTTVLQLASSATAG